MLLTSVGVSCVLGVALGSALEDVKHPLLSRGLSDLFFGPMCCTQGRTGVSDTGLLTYEACLIVASRWRSSWQRAGSPPRERFLCVSHDDLYKVV